MRHDERDKFSAVLFRLNYYLRLKGYESITKEEMMNIVWEELRSKATEMTLMGPLRPRYVACILKLRFDLTGNIDLGQVLEQIMPPEQDVTHAIRSQEVQEDVFVIDGAFVK